MATVQIPIPPVANTTGSCELRTTLDGAEFALVLQWNQRERMWTMDVADAAGVTIAAGIALVPVWSLLELVTDTRKPAGTLMIWQPAGNETAPTLEGLGSDSLLVYYEAAS